MRRYDMIADSSGTPSLPRLLLLLAPLAATEAEGLLTGAASAAAPGDVIAGASSKSSVHGACHETQSNTISNDGNDDNNGDMGLRYGRSHQFANFLFDYDPS